MTNEVSLRFIQIKLILKRSINRLDLMLQKIFLLLAIRYKYVTAAKNYL